MEEGRRGGRDASNLRLTRVYRCGGVSSRYENGWQMAIAGVEGNTTYTTTCLEREREEEEELNQQVNFGIST